MGAQAEEGFVAALDAAQEYMALQAALADALRAGFLSLAQARYSMGPDRVSALQFPAQMTATARLRSSEDGQLVLEVADPAKPVSSTGGSLEPSPLSSSSSNGSGSSGSGGWAKAKRPPTGSSSTGTTRGHPGAAHGGASDSSAAEGSTADVSAAQGGATPASLDASGTTEVEEQLQRLRLAAQRNQDVLGELAAKYCSTGDQGSSEPAAATGDGRGGEDDEEYADVAPPGRPLAWFGTLVAPSLRQAEAEFGEALALAVRAANAQRQLRRGLAGWQAADGSSSSSA